jgi:hypothetical protein
MVSESVFRGCECSYGSVKPQSEEPQDEHLNFVSKLGFKMEGRNRKWRGPRKEIIVGGTEELTKGQEN